MVACSIDSEYRITGPNNGSGDDNVALIPEDKDEFGRLHGRLLLRIED